ncbi:MAG TPA: PQQ-binding-like beta-propeller repeat protein [Gemmataceae bacterium]|nr:PQQ-binding-like beta-propeller repeat protein [Gemmataceae bacterium]
MTCLRSLLVLLFWCSVAAAADWPQWLGPNRDGSSSEKIKPWQESPKVLWRHAAGEGNSSPVVADGRVFLHAKIKDKDEEEVIAYDAESGKQLWRQVYPRAAFKSLYGNGPRATPAVAGNRIYTFGITGVLTCFEAATSKQVWQVDTLQSFKAKNLFFGVSCSPLVEGNKVLVNVGGKGASVVAFDKDTGEVAWKSQDDGASYASPIVFGRAKERQVVFLTQEGLVALNPADGSLLWRFPMKDKLLESSTTPVWTRNLLLASSITFGSLGLKLSVQEEKPTAEEAWKRDDLTCYFATPVAVGKHAYVVTGSNPLAFKIPEAKLHCIEAATGKELWSRPKIGKYHATLLRTGDRKLLMLDDLGNLVLLDPNPSEYRELARAKVCGEQAWAHPALSNGRLYVRDGKELICLRMEQ